MTSKQQEDTDQLRQHHRSSRAALSADAQARHAAALTQRVGALATFQRASHIAGYVAIRGEINVGPLLQLAHDAGKSVCLPVLRGDRMLFLPWIPGSPLKKRGMGLLEPDCADSRVIDPASLDLVLTPLVVFDTMGQRIGQGGGYYDRTFAFRRQETTAKPFLLGVAHEIQREPTLSPMPWDVPLDAIATDSALHSATDTDE